MALQPRRAFLFSLLAISGTTLFACRAPDARIRAPGEARLENTAPADPRTPYVLAFLVSGSASAELDPGERRSIQEAHLANIRRLGSEGKLVIAGPFGEPHLDPDLRGIFVFDTPDLATARTWTNTDPAVQAGVLGMELVLFRSPSPLRLALELDRAEEAELAKSGRVPELGERVRGYAMLLGRDARATERALAGLREEARVVFEGEFVGSPRGAYLAVLDAADPAEAADMLAPADAELGAHDLTSWWTMKSLAGLAARPR